MPRKPLDNWIRYTRFIRLPEGGDGCWLWDIAKTQNGYTTIRIPGTKTKKVSGHRIAWVLFNGPIPPSMFVLHHCDTKACVRPDHLYLGTPKENMRDKIVRQRTNHPYGERSGSAKLSNEDVIDIRHRYSEGTLQKSLANEYRVDQSTISDIVRKIHWKNI
jgi:hypothetical protein